MIEEKYDKDWLQVYQHREQPLMDMMFAQKGGKLFVDVGAHAGRWVLPMAHLFEKVIAFEPNPVAYAVLCRNIRDAKLDNVTAWGYGISDKPGTKKMSELDGIPSRSTLYPEYSLWDVTLTFEARFDRLDDVVLEEVSLVVVDTEGSELDVLKSAMRVLTKWKPRLCVETHSEALYGYCRTFLQDYLGLEVETYKLPLDPKHKYLIRR